MQRIDAGRSFNGIGFASIARLAAILFAVGFFLFRGLYAAEPPRVETRNGYVEVLHGDGDDTDAARARSRWLRVTSAARAG
jgi:hypothetical protein